MLLDDSCSFRRWVHRDHRTTVELHLVPARHTVARPFVTNHIHHLETRDDGTVVVDSRMKMVAYCQIQAAQGCGRPSGVEVAVNRLRWDSQDYLLASGQATWGEGTLRVVEIVQDVSAWAVQELHRDGPWAADRD